MSLNLLINEGHVSVMNTFSIFPPSPGLFVRDIVKLELRGCIDFPLNEFSSIESVCP